MRLAAASLVPRFLAACALAACALVACATAPPPADGAEPPLSTAQALRARAAAELSCPAHLLRITALGDQMFAGANPPIPLYQGVEGCGLSVIYTATKEGYVLSAPKHVPPRLAPQQEDVR